MQQSVINKIEVIFQSFDQFEENVVKSLDNIDRKLDELENKCNQISQEEQEEQVTFNYFLIQDNILNLIHFGHISLGIFKFKCKISQVFKCDSFIHFIHVEYLRHLNEIGDTTYELLPEISNDFCDFCTVYKAKLINFSRAKLSFDDRYLNSFNEEIEAFYEKKNMTLNNMVNVYVLLIRFSSTFIDYMKILYASANIDLIAILTKNLFSITMPTLPSTFIFLINNKDLCKEKTHHDPKILSFFSVLSNEEEKCLHLKLENKKRRR